MARASGGGIARMPEGVTKGFFSPSKYPAKNKKI
jgi:hypothetical protein